MHIFVRCIRVEPNKNPQSACKAILGATCVEHTSRVWKGFQKQITEYGGNFQEFSFSWPSFTEKKQATRETDYASQLVRIIARCASVNGISSISARRALVSTYLHKHIGDSALIARLTRNGIDATRRKDADRWFDNASWRSATLFRSRQYTLALGNHYHKFARPRQLGHRCFPSNHCSAGFSTLLVILPGLFFLFFSFLFFFFFFFFDTCIDRLLCTLRRWL